MTPPKGRLLMTIRSAEGELLDSRSSRNIVLRKGAELIAALFSGQSKTSIDRVRVGFGTSVADEDVVALTPPPTPIEAALLEAPLESGDFTVAAEGDNAITVRVAAKFTPQADIPDVSEAGLLAGNVLYNQVVFEPVTLRKGQDITFFWQIDFPFGR
ncbi:MAG TPA: hypothetical protein VJ276_15595 [Thermoanaerobaculia bacterium]|nr:hypothetical protein [Thermoanaerobaculia bacterium]